MPQTAEEYMPMLYEAEWNMFGFIGTNMPYHVKEFILDFDNASMPEDDKERLVNKVGRCLNHRFPLPEGVRITTVKILFAEDERK